MQHRFGLLLAIGYFLAKVIFWSQFPLGMSPVLIGMFFFSSVQLFFIGVIGEYIGAHEGLGYFILYASQTYDAPALFSGIIILVAIVFFANFLLSWLESRVIRWRKAGGQTVQL